MPDWCGPVADDKAAPVLLDPVAGYQAWAAEYPPYAHNPFMKAEERALLPLLPKDLSGKFVLDAGCGTARYLIHALDRGAASIVGIDQSAEMLRRARAELAALNAGNVTDGYRTGIASSGIDRAGSELQLLLASLENLPLPDQWADLTICALTIGHLPTLRPALAELRRVTKAGGVILCSDFHPAGHALGWQRTFSVNGRCYGVRHTAHYHSDWQQACAALGLEIVRVLEPHLDPADIPYTASFDVAALSVPAAIVYQLLRT